MDFQVGDQVVHWSYGPGEIVQLDVKELSGRKSRYYVVQIGDLTLWVPIAESGASSLRLLTPPARFKKLFAILSSPGEALSTDRLVRKQQLSERMKDGQLESICKVIRDLSLFKHTQKMSEMDVAIMNRAQAFLLSEWTRSLSVSQAQAAEELQRLLTESLSGSVHK